MRVFIGSSGEQKRLVEWLTAFMRTEYAGKLEPVPWTIPWAGGSYTLENLLRFVEETDASILFWTADDKTWYRDTTRQEPRDNLVFEAGLFIAAHGRNRTQLMIPQYPLNDPRGKVAVPTDVQGMTWNPYQWVDGPPEATGLPLAARVVCDRLWGLGPRPRHPFSLQHLAGFDTVSEIRTFVGDWGTLDNAGIARLAASPEAREIDILAAYSLGDIRRELDAFKQRKTSRLRACFANMLDDVLIAAYRRKYYDRTPERIRNALQESIQGLLGPCELQLGKDGKPIVSGVESPPEAAYEIRLTDQRITYGYYRIDDVAFLVPLDMKRSQNPAPMAWVLDRDTAPRAFARYCEEYNRMFEEAYRVYPEN
ncbi:MAG TPA: TIR domain-containing protein [Thermoanaerobaculia bacterium]|nr:TIR domain-containing protein [Thermoanaerobaculia bacterium]